MPSAYPYCIAFAVDATALSRLLEDGAVGGYRDAQPWWVAADMLGSARSEGQTLYALLVSGAPPVIQRWAEITEIEVHEAASTRETQVRFGASGDINPIFVELDSIILRPAEYVLERERREGLRQRRLHLDAEWLHAYAICETPSCLPPP